MGVLSHNANDLTRRRSIDVERRRIEARGLIQGVGFRPFIHRLAVRFGLTGFVRNEAGSVVMEVQGSPANLDLFARAVLAERPPLARVSELSGIPCALRDETEFTIEPSATTRTRIAQLPPDIATCEDCRRELFDPTDRRYQYPFINCTNCGPRFSVIHGVPYDRPTTTMSSFTMCDACQSEYDDPGNRRFHAQPNACPTCGPTVAVSPGASPAPALAGPGAIQWTRDALHRGNIVAIKGLGGFHLAADAANPVTVVRLRDRKHRDAKPFAVMARDVTVVKTFAHVSEKEATELTSAQRPIVLLKKRVPFKLAPQVAPDNGCIGVMLPYTPLHELLFAHATTTRRTGAREMILVMTSANRSGEPIVIDNDSALRVLGPIANSFLQHDRDIYQRCDDSVVRVIGDRSTPIRRSRGYAPMPVSLPWPVAPTLAVGGELKSTFCLASEGHAFISQHLGDMANLETLNAFQQAVDHYTDIFGVEPEVVACDMHPSYLSRRWAMDHHAGCVMEVQHHHAHIASAMVEVEHDGRKPVIGFAFDGTGYGTDNAVWGGEVLLAHYADFQRIAHLEYVPLPGGDSSVKRPYRYALSLLRHAGLGWSERLPAVAACPTREREVLQRQLERDIATVRTSSMGRLFDGVASLAGLRQEVSDEGQAAIALEALAHDKIPDCDRYQLPIHNASGDDPWQVDVKSIIRAVVADVLQNVSPAVIATAFHVAIARMIIEVAERARRRYAIDEVVLSGGVFQNGVLTAAAVDGLAAKGFRVITHSIVPPNDGGLALGQVAVAHASVHERSR